MRSSKVTSFVYTACARARRAILFFAPNNALRASLKTRTALPLISCALWLPCIMNNVSSAGGVAIFLPRIDLSAQRFDTLRVARPYNALCRGRCIARAQRRPHTAPLLDALRRQRLTCAAENSRGDTRHLRGTSAKPQRATL